MGDAAPWAVHPTRPALVERLGRRLRALAGRVGFPREIAPLPPDPARRGRPVLLLHGFPAPRRSLRALELRLRREGHSVFSLRLGGLTGVFGARGIDDLAAEVRAEVERLHALDPELGPLTIVGHSIGGLAGAYYVKRLGGWRRARALVTIGTPHAGTPAAYAVLPLDPLAPSLWQVAPGSAFLERLRGPWPRGVRVTSIYTRWDRLVPFPSAVLDTLGHPLVRNVEVEAPGNGELLRDGRTYRLLVEELRAEDPAQTTRQGTSPPLAPIRLDRPIVRRAAPPPRQGHAAPGVRLVWDAALAEAPGAWAGPAPRARVRHGTQAG
jgi:pimeloyl-ACP methyl ester carboxylesterase